VYLYLHFTLFLCRFMRRVGYSSRSFNTYEHSSKISVNFSATLTRIVTFDFFCAIQILLFTSLLTYFLGDEVVYLQSRLASLALRELFGGCLRVAGLC